MNDAPTPGCLAPTAQIDSDHPDVQAYARRHATGDSERVRAVRLVQAVRDDFRYDPYRIDLSPRGMRASTVLEQGYGWCVPKATLLAACARAVGIPARLGFADVRNHLSTERMRETMKTDLFVWHGYTELWLGGAWRKATPAFNLSLCEKFGLHPLDFDGEHDSIYHPFDKEGRRHMEYVRERGSFEDLPLPQILASFHEVYGSWMPGDGTTSALSTADFQADVQRETGDGPGR